MTGTRTRREPPAFRRVAVRAVEQMTPRLVRITFAGSELDGFTLEQAAASVRVLLPPAGSDALVVPTWNGNEFLLPDGRRPTIRTFTPWRLDEGTLELDVGIVLHGAGAASEWAAGAGSGDPAAISGPGRGYVLDHGVRDLLVAGDETAIPAMSQLLTVAPRDASVRVHVEIASPDARFDLPDHPHATVEWHEQHPGATRGDALVAAVEAAAVGDETRVWVAGEAAAVQRIRRNLFTERGVPRSRATIRGYWKHGRTADAGDDD